ncbi:MAG: DUF1491 family protein [Alphaproteobacteria bacterium]|nr:DUF1491 family protein [Alphaproteobacteria bacterium]
MTPRLKSAVWVSALLRRTQAEGLFGAVLHRGAEEAGAIYVLVNHLDGTCHLFGPAPGASINDAGERRFSLEVPARSDVQAANELIARRRHNDPDIWVVEIEDRKGTAGLTAIDL